MKFEEAIETLSDKTKERLSECKDINQVISILREDGVEINESDLVNLAQTNVELTDDELDNVVGGLDVTYLVQEFIKFLMCKIKKD